MATHSSVLALRIPGTGSLVGRCLWGRTESNTTETTQQQQQQQHQDSCSFFCLLVWLVIFIFEILYSVYFPVLLTLLPKSPLADVTIPTTQFTSTILIKNPSQSLAQHLTHPITLPCSPFSIVRVILPECRCQHVSHLDPHLLLGQRRAASPTSFHYVFLISLSLSLPLSSTILILSKALFSSYITHSQKFQVIFLFFYFPKIPFLTSKELKKIVNASSFLYTCPRVSS